MAPEANKFPHRCSYPPLSNVTSERPLVASPENRRRAGAGRRRPNPRDGSTKRCVVLSLDGPDGGDNGDGKAEQGGGGADKRSRGAGEEEGPSRRRSRKRPLGGSGESLTGWSEGGKANPASPPPPPLPQRRVGGKVEGSWLTLRKALHERYRDFQENGAAEQAASEADRGSGSKGSGWGGEVLLPGLRWARDGDGDVWSFFVFLVSSTQAGPAGMCSKAADGFHRPFSDSSYSA